jgi:hypothetical protein
MNLDQLGAAFRRIAEEVCNATDPQSCWSQILSLSGQSQNERLANLDMNADIDAIHAQLAEIFKTSPPPENLAFFYFGLFERRSGTGYYVSGYEARDASATLTSGQEPSFFPANRHLSSRVLEVVDAEAARMPAERKTLTYAVTFGAGAVLSRFAMLALQFRRPVYVGFDSGDFARIE